MKKRVCPKCGDRFSISESTCSNCGANLTGSIVEIQDEVPQLLASASSDGRNRCRQCDAKLSKNAVVCPICGVSTTKSATALSAPSTYEGSDAPSSNTFLYVISAVIPLVGIIAGAVLLTDNNPYKKSSGKTCVLIGIISALVCWLIIALALGA